MPLPDRKEIKTLKSKFFLLFEKRAQLEKARVCVSTKPKKTSEELLRVQSGKNILLFFSDEEIL